MNEGEGLSTEELLAQGYAQMRQLKNLVATRRRREAALELVTDLFLTVNALSLRVGGMTFVERPVHHDDEDEDGEGERMPMAELLPAHEPDEEHGDVEDLDEEGLRMLVIKLRRSRAEYYRTFLAWHVRGCKHERDVLRKFVAVARRLRPELLQQFGLSQADVGRKFGERRATVSAREKRVVEKPLKEAGARGVLGAGARGDATRARNRKAAKGNKNRARAARGMTKPE